MSASASGSKSKSVPQATPEEILKLYSQYLPSTMGITMSQAPTVTSSLASAAAGSNPVYTASGLDQLQKYAPGYTQAGIDAGQQQSAATASLLKGSGRDTALAADALSREINPEQYATRSNLANSTNNMLNLYSNGDRLTGGEMAAAERAINQGNAGTGNLGNTNPMNTVANAMNFGQFARQKQSLMNDAIGTANNVVGNLSNGDPVTTALNSSNISGNFGLSQFNPTQANATLGTTADISSMLFGGLAGLGAASTSKSKSSSASGGIADCCFIFLEAQNGKMPWWVRMCRDYYYHADPSLPIGYKKMAKWLVPLMKRFSVVKWLVNRFMVIPMTRYGGYLCKVPGYETCGKYEIYKKFWFTVWSKTA